MQELFANNAISTLASAITSTATSIALAPGTGSPFPNPTPGSQFFRISLTDVATKTNHEICYCTARSGDTLTVTRNAEQVPGLAFPSSSGSAWSAGDIAANEVTAGMMINLYSPSADQANNVRYGVDTGTANAYAVALNPSLTTPTQAAEVIFKPLNANTGASTIALNGGSAFAILTQSGQPLTGGEISSNGLTKLIYNSVAGAYSIEYSYGYVTGTSVGTASARKNLVVSASGLNSIVSIAADELLIENASHNYLTARSVSLSINMSASGANGLDTGVVSASTQYYAHVIWNGSTLAAIASLSATSPSLPSGYSNAYKARVSGFYTDSTANKFPLGYSQKGVSARFTVNSSGNLPKLPVMSSGIQGSGVLSNTPSWQSVSMIGFIPTTASKVFFTVNCATNGAGAQFCVAPNNQYSGLGTTLAPPPICSNGYGFASMAFDMLLESSNIYWVAGNANLYLNCIGWEDNL